MHLKSKLGGKFNFLPKSLRKSIKTLVEKTMKKKKRELKKKQKQYIFDQLKSDMTLFSKEYKFPVSKWGF
jgi:hypothetical protein